MMEEELKSNVPNNFSNLRQKAINIIKNKLDEVVNEIQS